MVVIYGRLVQKLVKETFTACVLIYQHLVETFLWPQIPSTLTKFGISLVNKQRLETL